jgi:hypothetical protein
LERKRKRKKAKRQRKAKRLASAMEDIRAKIKHVVSIYMDLSLDESIGSMLEDLSQKISKVRSILRESGMAEICKLCDEKEGGSCCGKGIESYYDEPLLLLNCLLGVNIQAERLNEESCLFLGPTGCRLLARHSLCVNYMCEKLLKRYTTSELMALKDAEGEELELTCSLCEILRPYIDGSKSFFNTKGCG